MSVKNSADLTTENNSNVTNQTTPESITAALLGGANLQDIIDSMYNRLDDELIPAPISMTKAQLLTAITNSTLTDGQQVTITDRSDGFPLIVWCKGINLIHPFGSWFKGGKPLFVLMDYANVHYDDSKVFYAWVDGNGKYNFSEQLIIADGTQSAGAVLVSDVNGKTSWQKAANSFIQVNSPASMTGATAKMMGLAGSITPAKSGTVLIIISGEFISADTTDETVLVLKTGTGTAPTNGATTVGTTQHTELRVASSSTLRIPFSFSHPVSLTVGVAQWIDLLVKNNSSTGVQLFNVSISAFEQ